MADSRASRSSTCNGPSCLGSTSRTCERYLPFYRDARRRARCLPETIIHPWRLAPVAKTRLKRELEAKSARLQKELKRSFAAVAAEEHPREELEAESVKSARLRKELKRSPAEAVAAEEQLKKELVAESAKSARVRKELIASTAAALAAEGHLKEELKAERAKSALLREELEASAAEALAAEERLRKELEAESVKSARLQKELKRSPAEAEAAEEQLMREMVAESVKSSQLRKELEARTAAALAAEKHLKGQKVQLQEALQKQRAQIEIWRLGSHQSKPPPLQSALPDCTLLAAAEAALRGTAHAGPGSRCNPMSSARVVKVQPIVNPPLWRAYRLQKSNMREAHRVRSPPLEPGIPAAIQNSFPSLNQFLEKDLNERLAFHGTLPEHVVEIARDGFEQQLASATGLYGAGIYFAEQSCKSLRYTGTGDERCILLVRLTLGEPHLATCPMRRERLPPLRDPKNLEQGRFDSVVANEGTPNGTGAGLQRHREFVLFKGAQAYPELAIFFTV